MDRDIRCGLLQMSDTVDVYRGSEKGNWWGGELSVSWLVLIPLLLSKSPLAIRISLGEIVRARCTPCRLRYKSITVSLQSSAPQITPHNVTSSLNSYLWCSFDCCPLVACWLFRLSQHEVCDHFVNVPLPRHHRLHQGGHFIHCCPFVCWLVFVFVL